MKKQAVLLSFFFVLVLFACDKEESNVIPIPNEITTPSELTEVLETVYEHSEAPGFAVSIVKNDIVLYQESFGMANIADGHAYTNQTVQPIGSISKTFVAAAVVKAIEQGHFTLETDINDILPFALHNPKHPNATIKVKHLVTHTSGLLDAEEAYIQAYHILPGENLATEGAQLLLNGFGVQQRGTVPLGDFLAAYYRQGGNWYSADNFADTAPGAAWSYSNIATSLAAYLVEVATETPFDVYVTTHILQPLGMFNTAYGAAGVNAANLSTLYWERNIPLPYYYNDSYPDGSIVTSNEDLAKFLTEMMKGAKGQTNTLFSTEGYALLFEAMLPEGLMHPAVGENQGIFWALEDGDIKHSGSDPGTTCNLLFAENGSAGYFLLTNMDASTDAHEAAYYKVAESVHAAVVAFLQKN